MRHLLRLQSSAVSLSGRLPGPSGAPPIPPPDLPHGLHEPLVTDALDLHIEALERGYESVRKPSLPRPGFCYSGSRTRSKTSGSGRILSGPSSRNPFFHAISRQSLTRTALFDSSVLPCGFALLQGILCRGVGLGSRTPPALCIEPMAATPSVATRSAGARFTGSGRSADDAILRA